MEQIKNRIYASPQNGIVERFFSSVFEQPKNTDILVEEGNEDYHAHVHLKYRAINEKNCHNYKVVGCNISATTVAERTAEFAAKPTPKVTPSIEQRTTALESAVLAMLGGASNV